MPVFWGNLVTGVLIAIVSAFGSPIVTVFLDSGDTILNSRAGYPRSLNPGSGGEGPRS